MLLLHLLLFLTLLLRGPIELGLVNARALPLAVPQMLLLSGRHLLPSVRLGRVILIRHCRLRLVVPLQELGWSVRADAVRSLVTAADHHWFFALAVVLTVLRFHLHLLLLGLSICD